MAKFSTEGLDALQAKFAGRKKKVTSTVYHMLNAGAKIMKEEIQQTMTEMDIKDSGDLVKSVKSSGVKKSKEDGYSISVAPSGADQKGVRNMTKAMIAQYGKKGEPARPWKTVAEERGYPKAKERMAEIFNEAMNEE
jgi:hypothetical protein